MNDVSLVRQNTESKSDWSVGVGVAGGSEGVGSFDETPADGGGDDDEGVASALVAVVRDDNEVDEDEEDEKDEEDEVVDQAQEGGGIGLDDDVEGIDAEGVGLVLLGRRVSVVVVRDA